MKPDTINNEERRQWILNDEHLYSWQRSSRLPIRMFIREYQKEIDEIIRARLSVKPQS